MQRYKDFAPTPFDSNGLGLDDRQDWFVVECTLTRDSGTLAQSNFEAAMGILDDAGAAYEVHRFSHWGPGWFEVILVHPDHEGTARSIGDALSDYPVLDDEDFSRRADERAQESWEWMSIRERMEACVSVGLSMFAARREQYPYSLIDDLAGF